MARFSYTLVGFAGFCLAALPPSTAFANPIQADVAHSLDGLAQADDEPEESSDDDDDDDLGDLLDTGDESVGQEKE